MTFCPLFEKKDNVFIELKGSTSKILSRRHFHRRRNQTRNKAFQV